MAQTIVIVPGLNGSGPTHWQPHWEALLPNAVRVVQSDWTRPRRGPWVDALTDTIDARPGPILVAHSLGCALVANAVRQHPEIDVTAAMLVSPSDVDWVEHIEAVGPVPVQDDRRRQPRRSLCQVRAGRVFCR